MLSILIKVRQLKLHLQTTLIIFRIVIYYVSEGQNAFSAEVNKKIKLTGKSTRGFIDLIVGLIFPKGFQQSYVLVRYKVTWVEISGPRESRGLVGQSFMLSNSLE